MRCDRFRLLCEDQLQMRLVKRWLERHNAILIDEDIAPSGRGAASDYVIKQFPHFVAMARSRHRQQGLGFIAMIDGDNLGVVARKAFLETQLDAANMARREAGLRVAVFVPTWCVETWLLFFNNVNVAEHNSNCKNMIRIYDIAALLDKSAAALHTLTPHAQLPASLADFFVERGRL